jgi:hypothetical protein
MSGALKRTCVTLLLGTTACSFSYACHAPPREQIVTPDEQIALATDVAVAKVVRETVSSTLAFGVRPPVEYEFEVQQHILGSTEQRFVIIGAKGKTRPESPSSDHGDAAFWQDGGGRLYNDADCVLRPNFVVGESYLVFRGSPATWRSFEHIETVRGRPNPNDKWLSYVEAKLGGRAQWPPVPIKLGPDKPAVDG